MTEQDIDRICGDALKRLLLKGKAVVTLEAAKAMNRHGICLVGVESQTVGPEDSPREVHLELLEKRSGAVRGIALGKCSRWNLSVKCPHEPGRMRWRTLQSSSVGTINRTDKDKI